MLVIITETATAVLVLAVGDVFSSPFAAATVTSMPVPAATKVVPMTLLMKL